MTLYNQILLRMVDVMETVKTFNQSGQVNNVVDLVEAIVSTYQRGGTVFICGNGGSHADALHFAEELTGRFKKNRRPLGALALGEATHTTCVGNDYGFDHIFSRQLAGLANPADMLIGLSTSGLSTNVIYAIRQAQDMGLRKYALLGKNGGDLGGMLEAHEKLIVQSDTTERIQELHMTLLHIAIEMVERRLFPELYRETT